MGRESSLGITGSWSQVGRGAARRVFEAVSGEGWAWRRRWERWRHVGRGTELIWIVLVGRDRQGNWELRGYFLQEMGFFCRGEEVGNVVG